MNSLSASKLFDAPGSRAKAVIAALGLGLAVVGLLSGCGGGWPPPPGVEERGRLKTDTWETLRRKSPWKKPLEEDPLYLRFFESYQRMEDLDRRARLSGWITSEEYRKTRFLIDQQYAMRRSAIFRLRSSGTEDTPLGQAVIEWSIGILEDSLDDALKSAELFEKGIVWNPSP